MKFSLRILLSAETSLPLDAEEFACLDKQNNKMKISHPRSPLILLTKTMTTDEPETHWHSVSV